MTSEIKKKKQQQTNHSSAQFIMSIVISILKTIASGVAGAFISIGGAFFSLLTLGFTSGGIVAGSVGASMMSSAAVANGGGIIAGSLISVLQGLGAIGVKALLLPFGIIGSIVGSVLFLFFPRQ